MLRQISLVLVLLCCACAAVNNNSATASLPEPASADPAAMTYRSSWLESGKATLVEGVYRQPAAPGSASEIIVRLSDKQAFGMIDGREIMVVILSTQSGGTGTFYDLALLTRGEDGWFNSDLVLLGDRVDIHDLAIVNNQVVVTLTTHRPEEPMCCPTLRLEKRFAIQEGKLTAAGDTRQPGT